MRPLLIAACLALPAAAAAQSAAPSAAWRAWAGHDTFGFRDTAKSSPPVDGSPVEWRGGGPIAGMDWDHETPSRLHRFAVAVSATGGFVYDTGIGTVPRPDDESARFLEGKYEYRRYFARAIGFSALHAGIGVRGGGERRSIQRQRGGVDLAQTDSALSIAGVAALRFRPGGRVSAELEWANASALMRGHQRLAGREGQDGKTLATESSSWGGGWFTDLAARMDVRVAARASLLVAWGSRGEGWLFNHRAYTDERRRVMVGLTYAR